ncbi:MAG: hypothetical protein C0623_02050 [Desulfuromonas sp.]|nr:MAG: hypothetical protein C0623_02050 [Desulfuromonas sp.]
MDRFKRIAVLYNAANSDKIALKRAAVLAGNNKAKILAVHIDEPISSATQLLLGQERIKQFLSDRQYNVEHHFAKHMEEIDHGKIPLKIASGDQGVETIRFILENKCDLLMKTRDTPSKRQAISVTDMKLLRKCPVPVMLIKPGRKKHFNRIMAAVDLAPEKPASNELLKNILGLATSLSVREGAELDIVHAWQTFATTTLQGPRFKLSNSDVEEIKTKEKKLRESWLEEAISPYIDLDIKIRTHLFPGDPADVLTDFATKRRTDLLVMGSLGRGGLQGLLIGNTAERVLDNVSCSTLTIKPDDFICPVKV